MIPEVQLTFEGYTEVPNHTPVSVSPSHYITEGVVTRSVGIEFAAFLIEQGCISKQEYIEALADTEWANALITFRSGLNGTYSETVGGDVFWSQDDVKWFRGFVKDILKSQKTKTWEDYE